MYESPEGSLEILDSIHEIQNMRFEIQDSRFEIQYLNQSNHGSEKLYPCAIKFSK